MRFLLGIGYFFAFQFGNRRLVVEAAQLVEDANGFGVEGPFALLHGSVFFAIMVDFIQMLLDELDNALAGFDIITVH